MKKVDKEFNMLLAKGTAEEIAKTYNLKFSQAWNLFKKSETFKSVMNASDEYYLDMPSDIMDLWQNEKLFGIMGDSEDRAYGGFRNEKLG